MSVKIKPGRWRERGGGEANVEWFCSYDYDYPWHGRSSDGFFTNWQDNGLWLRTGSLSQHDLIEYLGPLKEVSKGTISIMWQRMHWDKEVAQQLNQLLSLDQAQAGPIIGIIAEHRQNAYNQGYKKASDDIAAVAAQKSTNIDWSESTTGAMAYFTKGGKTYKVEVHYCIEAALSVTQRPMREMIPPPAFTWDCRSGGFTIDGTRSYPTVRMAMDAAEQILKEIGLIDGQHNRVGG